jgi:hypothetical protein
MRPGETIRYVCEECLVAFDLQLLPVTDWPELEDEADNVAIDAGVHCCPFCTSSEIKAQNDRSVHDRRKGFRPGGALW